MSDLGRDFLNLRHSKNYTAEILATQGQCLQVSPREVGQVGEKNLGNEKRRMGRCLGMEEEWKMPLRLTFSSESVPRSPFSNIGIKLQAIIGGTGASKVDLLRRFDDASTKRGGK